MAERLICLGEYWESRSSKPECLACIVVAIVCSCEVKVDKCRKMAGQMWHDCPVARDGELETIPHSQLANGAKQMASSFCPRSLQANGADRGLVGRKKFRLLTLPSPPLIAFKATRGLQVHVGARIRFPTDMTRWRSWPAVETRSSNAVL